MDDVYPYKDNVKQKQPRGCKKRVLQSKVGSIEVNDT